ncbi:MAG: hypothetical protein IKO19_05420 [Candidatus Riflebacteria bacterium]|nr:hypothetical protein [Candidatus Riflebacteria bacterium]
MAADATETNGNALANQEKYEQSIGGRLQGIKTNWQTFWMDVADSAVVDDAISGLELLTKAVAGVGDVFGETGEAVVAFGGFLASTFLAGNIPKVLNAIVEFGKSDKTLFQTIAATNFGKGIADIINQFKTAGTLSSAFLGTIKSIGSALLGLASAHPILTGILAAIAGIVALKSAFDIINPSLDKLRSNAQESKNAYEEVGNKIDDLNQQLQTTQSRINEINSQENISLVD